MPQDISFLISVTSYVHVLCPWTLDPNQPFGMGKYMYVPNKHFTWEKEMLDNAHEKDEEDDWKWNENLQILTVNMCCGVYAFS